MVAPSLALAEAAAAEPAAKLRSLTPRRPGRSPERPIGSISKEGQHGEDSPVVVRSGCQAELCEDRADVGLHGARAQIKLGADGVVGSAFCHETEHVALPVGELSERVTYSAAAQQLGHDCGVDDDAAPRDTPDRIGQLIQICDPVFE